MKLLFIVIAFILSANHTLMCCIKHFALYGAAEDGRDYNTTNMSRVKKYNEYLAPYKAAMDTCVGSITRPVKE